MALTQLQCYGTESINSGSDFGKFRFRFFIRKQAVFSTNFQIKNRVQNLAFLMLVAALLPRKAVIYFLSYILLLVFLLLLFQFFSDPDPDNIGVSVPLRRKVPVPAVPVPDPVALSGFDPDPQCLSTWQP